MPGAPQPIRLRSPFTLGDVVVLTAAVRDLQRAHPGAFRVSVQTGAPEVWAHNPHVCPASPADRVIDLRNVVLDRSGATGRHYLHAYLDLINRRLGTRAEIRELKGDIHLSPEELRWHSDVWTLCGREIPFWVVSTGGKLDIPLKWWSHRRMQEVVDALRGRIQFVQVGSWGNEHPRLEGAIDLRGKTGVRDLIHLMHYADGVLCGVTSLMHLAAAVPTEHGGPRAAVILGGAREPASWEAYPGHEYLSTSKAVACAHCWKARLTECLEPRGDLPLCLDLITADEVISRIEALAASGRARLLSARDRPAAARARAAAASNSFDKHNLTERNAAEKAAEFIRRIPVYPAGRFSGRGLVMCAGGVRYFACAWVCVSMLRKLGCTLPIELWHLGRDEIDREMESLIGALGVRCVNAREKMSRRPMRNPLGWELKAYALLHCSFREVLFLDADNVPVRDPSFLFETPEYRATGALFWPDYRRLARSRKIWKLCGVPFRDEPEFESGQMVIDKERNWRALNLAWWYNDHSEFFYRHIHGDKETFHLAWRRLDQPYSMNPHPIHSLPGTMCQHDFEGRVLFQHRNLAKWNVFGRNQRIPGFVHEETCLMFLEGLRRLWSGRIRGRMPVESRDGWLFRRDTADRAVFESVALRNEYSLPRSLAPDDVVLDVGAHIGSFAWACHARGSRRIFCFEPDSGNCALARRNLSGCEGVAVRRAAVLGQTGWVQPEEYPGDEAGLNTGGCMVRPIQAGGSGAVRCVGIDELLRRLGRADLVKLDCEGSEWPILLGGAEWARVQAICGEYHLGREIERRFGSGKTLAPELLFETLARHFPEAAVEAPDRNGVGLFWAARTKNFFASGQRWNRARRAADFGGAARGAAAGTGGPQAPAGDRFGGVRPGAPRAPQPDWGVSRPEGGVEGRL